MKILLINKFLYPKGGDAICTLSTGKILAAHGHDVVFWGMEHPENPEYPYQDFFVSQTDYASNNSICSKARSALNIIYSLEARKKISDLLKVIKPDIVHLNNFAHQISPSIIGEIRKHNIPTVMTMHDYKMVCPAYSLLSQGQLCEKCQHGRYYYCAINRCTKGSFFKSLVNVVEMYLHHRILPLYKIGTYISPSLFLKDKVMEMGLKGDVVYLSNCVDVDGFQPAYEWEENSIVYMGRLSHEKGIETLINAVKDIDIKLKIIGDGPLKAYLQQKTVSANIRNIVFKGYQTGQQLCDEIRKSMFLVIPSEWYENNPRTVIEAFALGKPVIGASIGGIPELVRNWETGLTFTSGDVIDLRKKIHMMISNKEKISAMGRNARKYVEQRLNSEIYYKGLMEIYTKTIEKKIDSSILHKNTIFVKNK